MDEQFEARLANKRTFLDFLDDTVGGTQNKAKVERAVETKHHRLIVNLADLRTFNRELANRLIRHPGEFMQAFEEAVAEAMRNVDPKCLPLTEEAHIGFEGNFGANAVTPRLLLSPYLSSMVCVEGIVTKCTLVRPKVVKSVHYCEETGQFISREYRDVTATSGLPTGAVYPTKDDDGHLLTTEFGLSKYRDHQTVSIQEMPENSPPGQMPRSIDVICENDLVDVCKPGDRVRVVGIYKPVAATRTQGSMSGVFRTVVVANNVQHLSKQVSDPVYSQYDYRNIRDISTRSDILGLFSASLAPSIYGHTSIKKALVLLLLGGVEKDLPNGTHIRGDINALLVGDPSVAKSQMLRAIMKVAPLAISTTGRGSSGVGLTAAVTQDKDTGERRLEAGAMVLADRGIVCIDEFDKMNETDRVAIHEVMEQQTVTIAKAGIHASLNARCSVVAAANPIYGTYDRELTAAANIALPDSLLSRFDVMFVVLDETDQDVDRKISDHVLRMHRYRPPGQDANTPVELYGSYGAIEEVEDEEQDYTPVWVKYNRTLHGDMADRQQEILSFEFLRKYIHHSKKKIPKLTDEASEAIVTAYTEMRKESKTKTLPITARTLETIVRLSTAHAKLRLSETVQTIDVEAALSVLNVAVDYEKRSYDEAQDKEDSEARRRRRDSAGAGQPARDDGDDGDGDDGGNGNRRDTSTHAGRASRDGNAGAAPSTQTEGSPARPGSKRMASDRTSPVSSKKARTSPSTQEEGMLVSEDEDASKELTPDRIEQVWQTLFGHFCEQREYIVSLKDLHALLRRKGMQISFTDTKAAAEALMADEEKSLMLMNGDSLVYSGGA
eukprot:jgi/Chlat1/4064/Chrsp26S04106